MYLSFEVTITNNTGGEIHFDAYKLLVEHYAGTTCSVLIDPVFTPTLSPGSALPPGPSLFRFDVGPIPGGSGDMSPFATRVAAIYFDLDPQETDDCCFSWWAVPYPTAREASPLP